MGTLVATKSGLVPIEDIQLGDLVWAYDPETGETALKPVVQTFRNETTEWIHVTVNGETLTCTPEHPFYVPQKGWTSAIDLRAGDRLQLLNGEYVVVEQVQHELLESPETTYNFEVEDYHTYYVSGSAILVHNANCGKQATPKSNPDQFTKMRGDQGYKDRDGNLWKVDRLHKDHYDVSNSKGEKIREVDFFGNQIWPDGPKNKNKR